MCSMMGKEAICRLVTTDEKVMKFGKTRLSIPFVDWQMLSKMCCLCQMLKRSNIAWIQNLILVSLVDVCALHF